MNNIKGRINAHTHDYGGPLGRCLVCGMPKWLVKLVGR